MWPRDPATAAYTALREDRLDAAVSAFQEALPCNPSSARLRKDFAYTLLRTGDRLAARRQFEDALHLDPTDETAALEGAFLDYETGRRRQARRAFLRLRASTDPQIQARATRAFEGVDEPLRTAIARWQEALRLAPGQWSGHEELARLAEERDELDLAARHFEEAWRRRPSKSELLLDLARIWQEQGETSKARAALVTAWRTGSPRVSESAREQMNGTMPASSELAMAIPAEEESSDSEVFDAKEMGQRSLESNYLNDALKYLTLAYQQDPKDANILYQLGVTTNMLHRDAEALQWFSLARRSTDPEIAPKAAQAYAALRATQPGFHVSAWVIPIQSSRWNDTFVYGQLRGEYRLKHSILTPYVSLRFLGDTQSAVNRASYTFLSETSVIGAVGLKAQLHPRAFGWFEAGEAVSYVGWRHTMGIASSDYRGGVSWTRGWGRLLGSPEAGWFTESAVDGVYIHRDWNDMILYSQNQFGYTRAKDTRGQQLMTYLNVNLTADSRGHEWANAVEVGPGIRLRLRGMPRGMVFRYDVLYGRYTKPNRSTIDPSYWDARASLWYAISR